jgi:hypothetical protein
LFTIRRETGVLVPPSNSCSLGYRDTDDTMDIVQLRSSSSATDPIATTTEYQQGIYKRGMICFPVKIVGIVVTFYLVL